MSDYRMSPAELEDALAHYRKVQRDQGVEARETTHHELRGWTHCAGPCDQGRKTCPCPEACMTAEENALAASEGILYGLVLTASILAVCAVLWFILKVS